MYGLFWCALAFGGMFQEPMSVLTSNYLVALPRLATRLGAPPLLSDVICHGLGEGLVTALNFTPVLLVLFIFLTWLEECGYMARAAFLVDRMMQVFGLPGQAFVAMMIGFGCNVPAVMATRTIASQRDRVLTIMMAPFMSCSARLAIYAVFVSTFFSTQGHNVIMLLYLLGIFAALMTALVLQRTVVAGEASAMVIELPSYHCPVFKRIWSAAIRRLKGFLVRAIRLIVPISCILSLLTSPHMYGDHLLQSIAQLLSPIFAPLGISAENWPAIIAIFTGVVAKEVVIGSLNKLICKS